MKNKFLFLGFLLVGLTSHGFSEEAVDPSASTTPVKKAVRMKKKKIIKSSNHAPQSPKSSVKLDDVQQVKKPRMSESLQAWLKDLKKRVNHSQTQKNQIVAVAAVRGAETPDSPPLYWKGKTAEGPTNMPELKDFETAVDSALTADPMEAKEKLQSFILAYPKSSLVSDAQETLNRLEVPVNP